MIYGAEHWLLPLVDTGRGVKPAIVYDYQRTRGGEHPRHFLAGFSGYLHVDGYPGYHKVKGVKLVGCWAHARRKYDEAIKSAPPETNGLGTTAGQGLAYCNQPYAIERDLAEVSPGNVLPTGRNEASRSWMPIMRG